MEDAPALEREFRGEDGSADRRGGPLEDSREERVLQVAEVMAGPGSGLTVPAASALRSAST